MTSQELFNSLTFDDIMGSLRSTPQRPFNSEYGRKQTSRSTWFRCSLNIKNPDSGGNQRKVV